MAMFDEELQVTGCPIFQQITNLVYLLCYMMKKHLQLK